MLGNSRVAERLMTSQEGLGSLELDITLNSLHWGNAIFRESWTICERLWLHRSWTSASVGRKLVRSRREGAKFSSEFYANHVSKRRYRK
jgi:hypothetical protein